MITTGFYFCFSITFWEELGHLKVSLVYGKLPFTLSPSHHTLMPHWLKLSESGTDSLPAIFNVIFVFYLNVHLSDPFPLP